MKSLKALTLIEVLISAGIMALIFGAIIGFLIMSDSSWQIGRDKLYEQQQARIAIDDIASSLQLSSPRWQDSSGNNYTASLTGSTRIDFYLPRFYPSCCPDNCASSGLCIDSQNVTHEPEDIQGLVKVTYRLNPSDPTQLVKKEGTASETAVAHQINSVSFSCGCSGCSSIDESCPFVDVSVTTEIQDPYTLSSTIALRNVNITVSDAVEIEEPEEGGF